MKKKLFMIGLAIATFLNGYASDTIPASNELIEYTGRIDFSDPLAPKFSYSGISVRAYFTGTSLAVIMDDDTGENYYNVILDGEVYDTLQISKGKKTYPIADGLNDTIHEIELFKRTELTFGKSRFLGFVVEDGASLTPIEHERPYLIEYIGNSITCGYGNEGENGGTFGPATENHYLTYAAITSRNFNARHMAVSRSGIGVYRNYNGPAEGNADCMTNYYNRIFLYDEHPKYDFEPQPDLVCINLGTNDFSTNGGDSALYVKNYLRLIDTIQNKYEMPEIVCLLGPMISGSTLTDVRSYLQFIADSASNKGNVTFFEMSTQTGELGIGIDYHPTVAQHQKNAEELTAYIKTLMEWKINPLVIDAKTVDVRHIQLEFNTPVHDPDNNYSGFSISDDDSQYSIEQVYRDDSNPAILHMILDESLSPGNNIYLEYRPGTIRSEDDMKLMRIRNKMVSKKRDYQLSKNEIHSAFINLFPNPNATGIMYYDFKNPSGIDQH